jgi:hypothetical protein
MAEKVTAPNGVEYDPETHRWDEEEPESGLPVGRVLPVYYEYRLVLHVKLPSKLFVEEDIHDLEEALSSGETKVQVLRRARVGHTALLLPSEG